MISAAHCFQAFPLPQQWVVVPGIYGVYCAYSDSFYPQIETIQTPELYNQDTYSNDIAIITVKKYFDFTNPQIDKLRLPLRHQKRAKRRIFKKFSKLPNLNWTVGCVKNLESFGTSSMQSIGTSE